MPPFGAPTQQSGVMATFDTWAVAQLGVLDRVAMTATFITATTWAMMQLDLLGSNEAHATFSWRAATALGLDLRGVTELMRAAAVPVLCILATSGLSLLTQLYRPASYTRHRHLVVTLHRLAAPLALAALLSSCASAPLQLEPFDDTSPPTPTPTPSAAAVAAAPSSSSTHWAVAVIAPWLRSMHSAARAAWCPAAPSSTMLAMFAWQVATPVLLLRAVAHPLPPVWQAAVGAAEVVAVMQVARPPTASAARTPPLSSAHLLGVVGLADAIVAGVLLPWMLAWAMSCCARRQFDRKHACQEPPHAAGVAAVSLPPASPPAEHGAARAPDNDAAGFSRPADSTPLSPGASTSSAAYLPAGLSAASLHQPSPQLPPPPPPPTTGTHLAAGGGTDAAGAALPPPEVQYTSGFGTLLVAAKVALPHHGGAGVDAKALSAALDAAMQQVHAQVLASLATAADAAHLTVLRASSCRFPGCVHVVAGLTVAGAAADTPECVAVALMPLLRQALLQENELLGLTVHLARSNLRQPAVHSLLPPPPPQQQRPWPARPPLLLLGDAAGAAPPPLILLPPATGAATASLLAPADLAVHLAVSGQGLRVVMAADEVGCPLLHDHCYRPGQDIAITERGAEMRLPLPPSSDAAVAFRVVWVCVLRSALPQQQQPPAASRQHSDASSSRRVQPAGPGTSASGGTSGGRDDGVFSVGDRRLLHDSASSEDLASLLHQPHPTQQAAAPPADGNDEVLIARLPLLLLSSPAAAHELQQLFAALVDACAVRGTAAAQFEAYKRHFEPLCSDLGLALSAAAAAAVAVPAVGAGSGRGATAGVNAAPSEALKVLMRDLGRYLRSQEMATCTRLLQQAASKSGISLDALLAPPRDELPHLVAARAAALAQQEAVNARALVHHTQAILDRVVAAAADVSARVAQANRRVGDAERAAAVAHAAQDAAAESQDERIAAAAASAGGSAQALLAADAEAAAELAMVVGRDDGDAAAGWRALGRAAVAGFRSAPLERCYQRFKAARLASLDLLALALHLARQALLGARVASTAGAGLTLLLLAKYEAVSLAPYIVMLLWRRHFQRHRATLLLLSNVACTLTAGMIVCTEVYRQEWHQLVTHPQRVLLQRPGMLLVWSHVHVPLMQRLGAAAAAGSGALHVVEGALVYRFIFRGVLPALNLLPALVGWAALGFGLSVWEEARMRRLFACTLRPPAAAVT